MNYSSSSKAKGRLLLSLMRHDLKASPERVMQHFCAATGVPYEDSMLTWTLGVVEEWAVYKYYKEWHWNAMFSSGFNATTHAAGGSGSDRNDYPPVVEEEIQQDMQFYEASHHSVATHGM